MSSPHEGLAQKWQKPLLSARAPSLLLQHTYTYPSQDTGRQSRDDTNIRFWGIAVPCPGVQLHPNTAFQILSTFVSNCFVCHQFSVGLKHQSNLTKCIQISHLDVSLGINQALWVERSVSFYQRKPRANELSIYFINFLVYFIGDGNHRYKSCANSIPCSGDFTLSNQTIHVHENIWPIVQ